MEVVNLERFRLEGYLGSGAGYEAHAATDGLTGKQVVIKRPNPDFVSRRLHHGVERLSERLIEIHGTVGDSVANIAHMVGYTQIQQHDGFFGDSLNEEYRVLVEERARGIPLVGAFRDKFMGIPIGLGQNLFVLHPLVPNPDAGYFTVHQQLLDTGEAFYNAGLLLLDVMPQNIFFDPGTGRTTLIDLGAIIAVAESEQDGARMGSQARDIHDFYLEIFNFYATPDSPPTNVAGYGVPAGLMRIPDFEQQIDSLIQSYSEVEYNALGEGAVAILRLIQNRAYASFQDFRNDFSKLLTLLKDRDQHNPNFQELVFVWGRAMEMLSDDYWKKFLFDYELDLAQYSANFN